MSSERRAVAVFLALAVLATAPAVLLRPGPAPVHGAAVAAAVTSAAGARVCPSVPLYPRAVRSAARPGGSLLRALEAVPGVPPLTRTEPFSLGHRRWLGGHDLPTAFSFYHRRMRPIGFEALPARVRAAIGVRPTGPVDSPPLVYVGAGGAALLQGRPGGAVLLTLFCGGVEA